VPGLASNVLKSIRPMGCLNDRGVMIALSYPLNLRFWRDRPCRSRRNFSRSIADTLDDRAGLSSVKHANFLTDHTGGAAVTLRKWFNLVGGKAVVPP
jgi:hypothetical protein